MIWYRKSIAAPRNPAPTITRNSAVYGSKSRPYMKFMMGMPSHRMKAPTATEMPAISAIIANTISENLRRWSGCAQMLARRTSCGLYRIPAIMMIEWVGKYIALKYSWLS